MAKTGKVDTIISNDGQTRKVGDVGSQSTVVKTAKPPTTNINKVEIPSTKLTDKEQASLDKAKTSIRLAYAEVEVARQIALAEEKDARDKLNNLRLEIRLAKNRNPEYLAIESRLEHIDKSIDNPTYIQTVNERERIVAADPDIVKASRIFDDAAIKTSLAVKKVALIDEKADRIAELDARLEVLLAKNRNPEYLAIASKIRPMNKSIDNLKYVKALNEQDRIVNADPDIVKANKKLYEAIDKSSKSRKICRDLGITDDQLLSYNK